MVALDRGVAIIVEQIRVQAPDLAATDDPRAAIRAAADTVVDKVA